MLFGTLNRRRFLKIGRGDAIIVSAPAISVNAMSGGVPPDPSGEDESGGAAAPSV